MATAPLNNADGVPAAATRVLARCLTRRAVQLQCGSAASSCIPGSIGLMNQPIEPSQRGPSWCRKPMSSPHSRTKAETLEHTTISVDACTGMALQPDADAPPTTPLASLPTPPTAPTPAAAITPAERRAWSKQVQRALRVALTGIRSLRTAYSDEADAGERHLNNACNHLLRLLHVPALALPKETRSSLPDAKEASRAKLSRLCEAQVGALLASADRLVAIAQEACVVHAHGLDEFVSEEEQDGEGEESLLQGPGSAAHAAAAASITMGLGPGRAAFLLRHVAGHMQADAADKQAVARVVAAQAAAQLAKAGGSALESQGTQPPVAALSEQALSERSQVWLSVWMLSPRFAGLHGEEHDEMLLAGLQEALAAADV